MGGNLEEITVVNFPRSVDEEEAYSVLEFISGDLDYKIHSGNFGGFFSINDGELTEKYESEIKGAISSKKDFNESSGFSFLRDEENLKGVFSGIRFETIPGYTLEEHRRGEVKSWREIKKSIDKYFEGDGKQGKLPLNADFSSAEHP